MLSLLRMRLPVEKVLESNNASFVRSKLSKVLKLLSFVTFSLEKMCVKHCVCTLPDAALEKRRGALGLKKEFSSCSRTLWWIWQFKSSDYVCHPHRDLWTLNFVCG